jgi:hypothetical protein
MSNRKNAMEKVRITVYITSRQQRQLEHRAEAEGFPMAEIIRRALDTYLAWDDPTYAPIPMPQKRNDGSSPP